MAQELLAIGSGAGFAGDRWDAAGPVVDTLIARGGPAGLIYKTLGERTPGAGAMCAPRPSRGRLRAHARSLCRPSARALRQ